ncbi:hypothetical protein MMINT_09285 [Candidatus Methanomassiliicoccus intestinalis Issoire-Mx1]|uniref:Uncharacterized protein n=1 Tax=Methanomassiliicoccus intestinalis (strain Issoire-Mx1) TaxID=1295009 RepID=R9T5P9_METII|nr:hypothetical protein MMINT_09285 [Candidatus Methanomassiliicoccus intestinalis Issoire-Mx1]
MDVIVIKKDALDVGFLQHINIIQCMRYTLPMDLSTLTISCDENKDHFVNTCNIIVHIDPCYIINVFCVYEHLWDLFLHFIIQIKNNEKLCIHQKIPLKR